MGIYIELDGFFSKGKIGKKIENRKQNKQKKKFIFSNFKDQKNGKIQGGKIFLKNNNKGIPLAFK